MSDRTPPRGTHFAGTAAGLWSDWCSRSAQTVKGRRLETQLIAARAFAYEGAREDYIFSAEAALAREPGRQLVEAFERCRVKVLARLARPAEQGGFGWRLTYEQERLFDAMRDVQLLKMFGGSIERYLANMSFLRRFTPRPEELWTNVGVILPRRSGKSFIEELVTDIALLAFGSVGGNIFDYNMTGGAANRWLTDAESILVMMKDDEEFGYTVVHQAMGKSLRIKRKQGARNQSATTSVQVFGNATNARNAQNLRGTVTKILSFHPFEYMMVHGR